MQPKDSVTWDRCCSQKSPRLVGVYHPPGFEPTRGYRRCRAGVPDRQRRDVEHRKSSGSLEQGGEHRV